MSEPITGNATRTAGVGAAAWKIALATAIIFAAGVLTGGLLVGKAVRERVGRFRAMGPAAAPGPTHPNAVAPAPPAAPILPPLSELRHRAGPELQRRLEERRMEFLLRATRELNLSPEQRARIEQHIRESQERIRQLWDSIQPQLRREVAEARERIQQELTPEQRRAFERLLRREPGRRAEEPGAAPPPRPPGPRPRPER
ncbi:hypothetical protein [Limisphaera sp. VF-2]|jgi:hypothetical protein|uniref:hypothetical protein n=1 Tax=Limisphaera sp. VF-2 TaxID=3400418 RepID=UPI00176BB4BC|nr:hypothetical protein [Limisphaera sp.]